MKMSDKISQHAKTVMVRDPYTGMFNTKIVNNLEIIRNPTGMKTEYATQALCEVVTQLIEILDQTFETIERQIP